MTAALRQHLRRLTLVGLAALPLLLTACAVLSPDHEPKVEVVGVEPLPGHGLELRMAVQLRVLNPSRYPLDYDGIFLEMDLRGQHFASGVSNDKGSVPRFGEVVLTVPITVTALAIWQQAIAAAQSNSPNVSYQLRGKLSGPIFQSHRFQSEGEFQMPAVLPGRGPLPWQ